MGISVKMWKVNHKIPSRLGICTRVEEENIEKAQALPLWTRITKQSGGTEHKRTVLGTRRTQ